MSTANRASTPTNTKKNLDNVDFTNKKDRIDSPRSKTALRLLGIEEDQLYYVNKEDFLNSKPMFKSMSTEMKDKHFNHLEETRQLRIDRAKKMREKIIKNESNRKDIKISNSTKKRSLSRKDAEEYYSIPPFMKTSQEFRGMSKRTKSTTDVWNNFSKSPVKEKEELYILQKQNLCEVRNLIEFNLKLEAKEKRNQEKLLKEELREEKINYLRDKERQEQLRVLRELKIKENELSKIEQKQKEKEIREFHNLQIKKAKELYDKEMEDQKRNVDRQNEWAKQNEEHREKVNTINMEKMKQIENEYKQILIKDNERVLRLAKKREEIDNKNKLKNEKRNLKLKFIYDKKDEMRHKKLEDFNKRQKQIEEFADLQKEIKAINIKNQQNERYEKQLKNIYIRKQNEKNLEEKRNKLIQQFEIYDNKIYQHKIVSDKIWENIKFQNYLKKDSRVNNIMENKNKLYYKNMLKMKEMNKKQKIVENKIRLREKSAKLRRDYENNLHDKKQTMLRQVRDIFSKKNKLSREEIYNRVFSPDEMDIIVSEQDMFDSKVNNQRNELQSNSIKLQFNKGNSQSTNDIGFFTPNIEQSYKGNFIPKQKLSISKEPIFNQKQNINIIHNSYNGHIPK